MGYHVLVLCGPTKLLRLHVSRHADEDDILEYLLRRGMYETRFDANVASETDSGVVTPSKIAVYGYPDWSAELCRGHRFSKCSC